MRLPTKSDGYLFRIINLINSILKRIPDKCVFDGMKFCIYRRMRVAEGIGMMKKGVR